MKQTASAVWHGDLKSGSGAISTVSGVLSEAPYSFRTRFEGGEGTTPEELLAAAHAACFSMALSSQIQQAGFTAETLETKCTITLDKTDGGFGITQSHLDLKARVPGIGADKFDEATAAAKTGCPVSKLYNTNITLTVNLDS